MLVDLIAVERLGAELALELLGPLRAGLASFTLFLMRLDFHRVQQHLTVAAFLQRVELQILQPVEPWLGPFVLRT